MSLLCKGVSHAEEQSGQSGRAHLQYAIEFTVVVTCCTDGVTNLGSIHDRCRVAACGLCHLGCASLLQRKTWTRFLQAHSHCVCPRLSEPVGGQIFSEKRHSIWSELCGHSLLSLAANEEGCPAARMRHTVLCIHFRSLSPLHKPDGIEVAKALAVSLSTGVQYCSIAATMTRLRRKVLGWTVRVSR